MESLAGRVMLLWGWPRAFAAFLAGAVAALAQPPFDFFAVCFLSFPVLVWLLDGAVGGSEKGLRRFRPFFLIGWWFGFGYFIAGLWWTGKALLVAASENAWALPFSLLGLPALLAVFYGLAAALARPMWGGGLARIVALAFGFGAAEWLRATMLTGFPWNAIGYAAMPVPLLMQSIKITGLFGMNALAVFVFALPALLGTRLHARSGMALMAVLVTLHVGYGYARLFVAPEAQKSVNFRIVQPSIDQTEKWDRSVRDRIFKSLLDLSANKPADGVPEADVIVWPETAVPFLFAERPEALAELGDMIGDGQILLTGAVRTEGNEAAGSVRYYNAVTAINDEGVIVDAVDKMHLVPFGEYVPLANILKRIGLSQIVQSNGPFSPGNQRRPITIAGGVKALPFICYEIIFPQLVVPASVGSDIIINLTNDAWFGLTPGPYQHFRQARLRAVEAGLPLVRAANSGISAAIDPFGRIIDAFSLNGVGALDVAVPLARGDRLAFGNPGTNGPLIVLCFGIAALIAGMVRRSRSS